MGLCYFIWWNWSSSQSPQAFPERVTAQTGCLQGLAPFTISARGVRFATVVLTQQVRWREPREEFPAGFTPNAAVEGFSSAHLLQRPPAIWLGDLSARGVTVRQREREIHKISVLRRQDEHGKDI